MPFSSARWAEWWGSRRGSEEPFAVFGFFVDPLEGSGVEAFRFTAAFLGGMLKGVVAEMYALARVRVSVCKRN